MSKKDVYSILSLILFLLGVLFILTLNADITSAVIGITFGYVQNTFIGIIFLIFISFIALLFLLFGLILLIASLRNLYLSRYFIEGRLARRPYAADH